MLPVFCCSAVALLETELPYATSDTLRLTRSQPRSFLLRPDSDPPDMRYLKWSFLPMIRSLFHGDVVILKSPAMWEISVWLSPYERGADLKMLLRHAIRIDLQPGFVRSSRQPVGGEIISVPAL